MPAAPSIRNGPRFSAITARDKLAIAAAFTRGHGPVILVDQPALLAEGDLSDILVQDSALAIADAPVDKDDAEGNPRHNTHGNCCNVQLILNYAGNSGSWCDIRFCNLPFLPGADALHPKV